MVYSIHSLYIILIFSILYTYIINNNIYIIYRKKIKKRECKEKRKQRKNSLFQVQILHLKGLFQVHFWYLKDRKLNLSGTLLVLENPLSGTDFVLEKQKFPPFRYKNCT